MFISQINTDQHRHTDTQTCRHTDTQIQTQRHTRTHTHTHSNGDVRTMREHRVNSHPSRMSPVCSLHQILFTSIAGPRSSCEPAALESGRPSAGVSGRMEGVLQILDALLDLLLQLLRLLSRLLLGFLDRLRDHITLEEEPPGHGGLSLVPGRPAEWVEARLAGLRGDRIGARLARVARTRPGRFVAGQSVVGGSQRGGRQVEGSQEAGKPEELDDSDHSRQLSRRLAPMERWTDEWAGGPARGPRGRASEPQQMALADVGPGTSAVWRAISRPGPPRMGC